MGVAARLLGVDDGSFLRSVDVQLVFAISMASSMGSVASPALPAMSTALGVGEARIGLVFTAFTLPAIVVLPAVGAIADLYGRKVVVVPGLLLFGLAGLGVGLVDDFGLVLVLRGLQGIGYTAFNSLAVALLGDLLSGTEESAAQGARVLLNKLTGFVGPAVAGVLAALAWQYPFFLYGLTVPVAALVALRLSESHTPERSEDGTGVVDYLGSIRDLVARPFIAGVLAAGFVRMALKYALYTFLALAVVRQYGGGVAYAGLLVGLYSLVGAVVASQSARFTARLSHAPALLVGFLLASVAFVGFPLAGGLVGVTLLVLLHGVGEGIINPVHKSLMSQSVGADRRGGLVATNAIVQNVAKTVTPVALGPLLLVLGTAYDVLFAVTGALALVATVLGGVALAVGGVAAPGEFGSGE